MSIDRSIVVDDSRGTDWRETTLGRLSSRVADEGFVSIASRVKQRPTPNTRARARAREREKEKARDAAPRGGDRDDARRGRERESGDGGGGGEWVEVYDDVERDERECGGGCGEDVDAECTTV